MAPPWMQRPLWENLQPNMSHVIVPLLGLSVCTVTLVAPRRLATPCQTRWRQLSASILAVLTAKWTEEDVDRGQLRGAVQNLQHGPQKLHNTAVVHNRAAVHKGRFPRRVPAAYVGLILGTLDVAQVGNANLTVLWCVFISKCLLNLSCFVRKWIDVGNR